MVRLEGVLQLKRREVFLSTKYRMKRDSVYRKNMSKDISADQTLAKNQLQREGRGGEERGTGEREREREGRRD